MTNPDLERYAELWKGHNGYEEFDLEENEEQEYQSKKAKLEELLEKGKFWDTSIQKLISERNKNLEKVTKHFDHSGYHCMCDYCQDEDLQALLNEVRN